MKKFLLFCFCCSFSVIVLGQIQDSESIDDLFSAWNSSDSPGCALGIIKDGNLVYAKGYGMANLEHDIPISATSVFRIGSTSKQFTAACIIMLAEKEKLKLDDNLKSIFPEFPDYAEQITIRHLLNHTSGIRDYLQIAYLKGLGDDDYYTDTNVMKWLINQSDLNFAPGDEHLYSNSGYWLLGQIVKKVSGMNMAEYAKKEIFEPLGMDNTHFHNDHTQIVKNRAAGYIPYEGGYKISMTTLDMIGDGGIFTTINDIKKWDDAYYGSQVLSQEFWRLMIEVGKLNNGELIDYASGLIIGQHKGLETVRHGGAFVGFRAELLRFPSEKLSIAIFANRGDANPSLMAELVADILLKDKIVESKIPKEEKVEIEVPSVTYTLAQIVGDYEIQPGVVATLSIKDGELNVFQQWNKSTYDITKVHGNTYQIPGNETLSFTFSNLEDDKTQALMVLQGGRKTMAPRKKVFDTSKVNLADYEGSYYSKELDEIYNFELDNDVLKAGIQGKQQTMDCTIIETDLFSMAFGLVRFQRTEEKVVALTLDSGRVKNLKFKKQ